MCDIIHRLQQQAIGLDIKDEDECRWEVPAGQDVEAVYIAAVIRERVC